MHRWPAARGAGRLPACTPRPSIPPSASATSTSGSPTSTARSRSTATRSGFGLTADGREAGVDAAFLAAGDYHHHIGLNTFESAGGTPPPPGHTGLYHVAFVYPDRRELGRAVQRLLDHGHPIDHATDHGGTVSVYLADPDGNGVELYYDRPRADWFDAGGRPSSRPTASTTASCSSPTAPDT